MPAIDEFDAQEIWADYERGYGKLSDKEFVESKHYFALRKVVKNYIQDNPHLDDNILSPLKDAIDRER